MILNVKQVVEIKNALRKEVGDRYQSDSPRAFASMILAVAILMATKQVCSSLDKRKL